MRETNVIYGPPGTGKTQTLVDIAADLPTGQEVIFLSYTKAAAKEAVSRLPEAVQASTLHSLAFRLGNFTSGQVVDREKKADFGRIVGIPFSGSEDNTDDEQQEGDEYLRVLSYATNRDQCATEAYDEQGRPGTYERFKMCLLAYHEWKKAYGYADFDDMLMGVMNVHPSALPRCPFWFLDEAQDLSPLQWRVFEILTARAQAVWVAGDDDQAIYEWNGADPHGMAGHTDANSKVRTLSRSYRLPRAGHQQATAIIDKVERRQPKNFYPADRNGVVESYGDIQDYEFGRLLDAPSALVLVRDRYRQLEIQRILNADMIPYRLAAGWSPFDNRWAWAIRACHAKRNDQPLTEPMIAALKSANLQPDFDAVMKAVPHRLRDFYGSAPLHLPLSVTLSTVHGAKGREAHTVVYDATMNGRTENGIYINRDAELRVQYVACSRASEALHICGSNPLI